VITFSLVQLIMINHFIIYQSLIVSIITSSQIVFTDERLSPDTLAATQPVDVAFSATVIPASTTGYTTDSPTAATLSTATTARPRRPRAPRRIIRSFSTIRGPRARTVMTTRLGDRLPTVPTDPLSPTIDYCDEVLRLLPFANFIDFDICHRWPVCACIYLYCMNRRLISSDFAIEMIHEGISNPRCRSSAENLVARLAGRRNARITEPMIVWMTTTESTTSSPLPVDYCTEVCRLYTRATYPSIGFDLCGPFGSSCVSGVCTNLYWINQGLISSEIETDLTREEMSNPLRCDSAEHLVASMTTAEPTTESTTEWMM